MYNEPNFTTHLYQLKNFHLCGSNLWLGIIHRELFCFLGGEKRAWPHQMVKKKKQARPFLVKEQRAAPFPIRHGQRVGGSVQPGVQQRIPLGSQSSVKRIQRQQREREPHRLSSSISPMEMEISAKAIKWFVTQRKIWRTSTSSLFFQLLKTIKGEKLLETTYGISPLQPPSIMGGKTTWKKIRQILPKISTWQLEKVFILLSLSDI